MTGASVLPILLRRRRALLLSGVACAAIGFGVSRVLPQSYLGEGSLIVENKPGASEGQASATAVSNVMTQVDVLLTKGLIEKVVHDLNLVNNDGLVPSSELPDVIARRLGNLWDEVVWLKQRFEGAARPQTETEKAVTYVRKNLRVTANENSSVITVQFVAGSPSTAAQVTNAVMTTYLATITDARADQISKAEKWISEQLELRRRDVDEAEAKVMDYVQSHDLAEVQGSHVASVQMSEDQKQLVIAREELARKEAALSTVQNGGSIQAADETLQSKTIQSYKEAEAKTLGQLATLSQLDARRGPLNDILTQIRANLSKETQLIRQSLQREVEVARAKVDALQRTIKIERVASSEGTVAGQTMKQLLSNLDARRQLYVAFFTQAGAARVAAEQAPTAHVLFQAEPPERPYRAYGVLSVMLGFMAGVVGCAGLLLLRPKINFSDDMEMATGLPAFGTLPELKHRKLLAAPQSFPVSETYRALWLELSPERGEAATILVTSSVIGEGKTTVATGVARRFADDGFRVLLVEADLQRPTLASVFDLDLSYGIESVLNGSAGLEHAIVRVNGLDCLLAAERVGNPMREFSSERFTNLLVLLKSQYDYIIFDSPPVLHVADALLLGKLCRRILFLVQASRLTSEDVQAAIQRFAEPDRQKILTILTRVRRKEMNVRDYFSGYGT